MSKTAFHTDSMKTKSEIVVIHRLAAHILFRMRAKISIFTVAILAMVLVSYAEHDYQIISSGIGDSNLLTVGGFTFAKPILIDLMPTNVPNYDMRYSIRCQVVYKDKNLPRPETDEEKTLARATGKLLNSWLEDLVKERYTGVEFADLLVKYHDARFTEDLNSRFAEYVADKINEVKSRVRINIETVTVTVNAEGEFRAVLAELWKQSKAPQHN